LMENGAKRVAGYVTHGVLSGGAIARINASALEEMVTTDSILATEAHKVSSKMRQIAIAPLIGEAMKRISQETSVSSLFD
jgi:ribose-phosphate pyrophosphokinase